MYIVTGSAFISPRAYAITHRMHHAYTDTELDPHSPHHQNTVMKMMWRTRNFVLGIFKNTMEIDPKFSKNVPDWPWLIKWLIAKPLVLFGCCYTLHFMQHLHLMLGTFITSFHRSNGPYSRCHYQLVCAQIWLSQFRTKNRSTIC